MSEFAFYFIASCLCITAVLSVTVKDVFHSSVWLALSLLFVACLYFYLDAGFLGVIQVLVYVGGIMTLFVFAIMLTSKIGDHSIRQVNHQFWGGLMVAIALFIVLVQVVGGNPLARLHAAGSSTDLKTLGTSLVTTYALPFEYISLLLLAALVGAIVLGKVKK
ncbi:MAG: NADH-quinone oxidoreductase subunit J [Candidatus Omnitrophica bacterium]|nr:NADH-quinone oxidoreductase subunit J [Candidatus Omnitrophota bacterium]